MSRIRVGTGDVGDGFEHSVEKSSQYRQILRTNGTLASNCALSNHRSSRQAAMLSPLLLLSMSGSIRQ